MLKLLEYVAKGIRKIAVVGAGFASIGPGYQPKMPKQLQ